MEERLRSLGILGGTNEQKNLSSASIIDGIDLEAYLPPKKVYFNSVCSILWRVLHLTGCISRDFSLNLPIVVVIK